MSDVQPGEADQSRDDVLSVRLEHAGRVNFAMHQHGVPLVDRVAVTNVGRAPVRGVSVRLELENGSAEPWHAEIDEIAGGATYGLEPSGFGVSGRALAERTEAERTAVCCWVRGEGREPVSARSPVELLAFDQWPGTRVCPEMLAAFVTPNHPALVPVLRDAGDGIERLTGTPGLDGYQSASRTRAAAMAEAVYAAVSSRGVGYVNPPASFGREGQRVRLADRLLRERMGACLDLSLLLAGAWEQCGLHPVVLLFDDHAMAGVWTYEHRLSVPVLDDAASIRNRAAMGDLVVVESTLLAQRGAGFAEAAERGRERMERPGEGFHAVDIRACRARSIRPLPLAVPADEAADMGIDLDEVDGVAAGEPLREVVLADRLAGQAVRPGADPGPADGRVEQWSRRLLDLSLRNRLIHFRETKGTVELSVPDLAAFEDELSAERRFELRHREDEDPGYFEDELRAGRVHTMSAPAEHEKRLLHIYRTARSAIEETGAGVLYAALGSLRWFETPSAETPRRAPLLLLPVRLDRSSSGSGYRYRLSLTDDPIRPNITLLERLRTDFGIDAAALEALPEDEHGLDVAKILYRFRAAISEQPRWEVSEEAWLGLFSFSKFLMWRDLREQGERLRQNALVRHLVSPGGTPFEPEPLPDPSVLDETLAAGEPLCTRDADSTQLAAVLAASAGRSFVLEGPPGTGKSQTIANMIADNLASGRRVLFVAEKMAALSVVRRRLERDGLGPYCLELHSAKASKKQVLAQLGEALDAQRQREPAAWADDRGRLEAARGMVNSYVRELHAERPSGESLYTGISRLAVLGDGPAEAPGIEDPSSLTADQLRTMRERVSGLGKVARAVDPVGGHPLRGIGTVPWSFGLPAEAARALEEARRSILDAQAAARELLRRLGLDGEVADGLTHGQIGALRRVVSGLVGGNELVGPGLAGAIRCAGDRAAFDELRRCVGLGADLAGHRRHLAARFEPEFLSLPHLEHLDSLRRAERLPWPLSRLSGWLAARRLRVYARGARVSISALIDGLERAREAARLEVEVASHGRTLAALGDPPADADDVDGWARWNAVLDLAAELAGPVQQLGGSGDGLVEAVLAWAGDREAAARIAEAGAAYEAAVEPALREVIERLGAVLHVEDEVLLGMEGAPGWFEAAGGMISRWGASLNALNDWCAWRAARDAAIEDGLAGLVSAYEQGSLGRDELSGAFERGLARRWVPAVADGSPAIRGFHPDSHRAAVGEFRTADKAVLAAGGGVVSARLAAGMPGYKGNVSDQSELGVLRKELNKKSRHMATRRLIERLPTLLPTLKPCFLMSPLSVAQYLDASLPPFDLVVFDEASQIPVWDAVGAIARGTSVVVVGDSKQLPPTAFFDHLDEGDADGDDGGPGDVDLESILKECNAAGVPGMRLGWHYRSRHESLIAFSNHHYYQGELQTFPSPVERGAESGVTLRFVEDGVYDRGGSRTNRREAEAVADEVVRLLTTHGASRSVGVVTFSRPQQQLVTDLLDERRRALPEIDPFFDDGEEPVFVKNLENVQGDERDAMIFSVGYGPDGHGRVSMNFGPLNADGGERRLNVAVTRARRSLTVFTALRPEDIDLGRTRATGVRHFKAFLEYAERGPSAMAEATAAEAGSLDRPSLERVIASRLREEGHDVAEGVGFGRYRVDVAVRDPRNPERFLLGIECDGPMYRGANTARDRDRTRPSVLGGLGWRLERVWSVEWYLDPERCFERLTDAIVAAMQEQHEADPVPEPPAEPVRAQRGASAEDEDDLADQSERGAADQPPAAERPVPYSAAPCPDRRLRTIDLVDPRSRSIAVNAIAQIAVGEGPVCEEVAQRRFAEWFGVTRRTAKFRRQFEVCLADAAGKGMVRLEHGVLWAPGQDPRAYSAFRVPGDTDESRRELGDIPLVERANALAYALRTQFGLPEQDLLREGAELLGASRLTSNAASLMEQALEHLRSSGLVGDRGGLIVLVNEGG